ncbi:MAG: hypothetical protein ACRCTR_09185 [Actinomycetota bacterium]
MGRSRRLMPWALTAVGVSMVVILGVASLGPSAASPALPAGIGWRSALPPWSLTIQVPSWVVTVSLTGAYLVGGLGVGLGLLAARRGEKIPRHVRWVASAAAVMATFLPPLGSADHISYAAYGRVAAAGGDPYLVAPVAWAGGTDPITSAVEPPWTQTPSVYGPVATMVHAGASLAGGTSLRATVWVWQLICLACWLTIGVAIARRVPDRGVLVWLLNPVLFGVLLVGAHVDLLAVVAGGGALILAFRGRWPGAAGLLLGAAVGVKLTAALFGPVVLYAIWRRYRARSWRPVGWGIAGAAGILVPAHWWAGPHVFDQLSQARQFFSLGSALRPVLGVTRFFVGDDAARAVVLTGAPMAMLGVAFCVWRIVRRGKHDAAGVVPVAGVGIALAAGYVLAAPYTLPWYDAMVWCFLAFVPATAVDGIMLVRLVAYAAAYVPGRVVGSSLAVQNFMVTYRSNVVPAVGLALILALVWWARAPRARSTTAPRSDHQPPELLSPSH